MVGAPEPPRSRTCPSPEAPDAASPSPFDVDLDESAAEELFDVPAPPSWDDVVETCLGLAQARGAMLVDPAGQVFAAHGDWPEPGAGRDRGEARRDDGAHAQGRPHALGLRARHGKHLTAWRVPLAEGLVTAAFLGDSPVRAEARPPIDAEIHRGPGA